MDANASFCVHCGTAFSLNEQSKNISPGTGLEFQSPPVVQRQRKVMHIIALSACAVLALVILASGYWLIPGSQKDNQTGQFPENTNVGSQSQTLTSSNTMVSSSTTKQQDSSTVVSANSVNSTSTTSNSFQSSDIRDEVSNALLRWKSDAETLNFSAYMNNYADTVSYYRAGPVDRSRVSKDKQRAFRLYNSIKIGLDNMKITTDAGGNSATVIVDKSWYFQGGGKTNEGEVQQQLTLEKINNYWYITGEKDLKVYYSRSY